MSVAFISVAWKQHIQSIGCPGVKSTGVKVERLLEILKNQILGSPNLVFSKSSLKGWLEFITSY